MNIKKMSEHIEYLPQSGQMIWKKSLSNRASAGSRCGANVDSKGYGRVCFDGNQYRAHRVAWALHYGKEPSGQVDHINGDKLDNRIDNLRLATNTQNSRNSKTSKNNTSGIKGVTWHKAAGQWMAQICVDRKTKYLGLFASKEQAAEARKNAEKKYFGEYVRTTE